MNIKQSANKIKNNFVRHPIYFVLRQFYRVLVVFPYLVFISLLYLVNKLILNISHRSSYELHRSNKSVCFIISSVIYCNNKELSYAKNRSVYTPEERANQTIKTVETIRRFSPESYILLVEAGFKRDLPFELHKMVDEYLYLGNHTLVRKSCDCRNKSLGEIVMLLFSKRYLAKIQADFYCKISGRYELNENFNLDQRKGDKLVFLYKSDNLVSTRLYSFSRKLINIWYFALLKSLPLALIGYPVESLLAKYIPSRLVIKVDTLGLSGSDATCGKRLQE